MGLGYESNDILSSEYDYYFDIQRQKAIRASYYKYGPARDNFGGGRVDALKSAENCIEAFKKDHNLEHLVDAANYLMFRFKYPYEGDFFIWTDSDKSVPPVGTPINME